MGTWYTVEISGKSADVFEPARGGPQGYTVLFLHGHAEISLKNNDAYSSEFERFGLRCICPHGRRSWWGERICREFDSELTPAAFVRQHVLPWLNSTWGVAPPRIGLLGVSMGGQGALKLAYRDPELFPVVVVLAPAVDFHTWHGRGLPLDEMYPTRESARQDTATLLIHPLNWPRHQLLLCDPTDEEWFEGVERLASKLSSTGIPFDHDFTTSHGGHSWDYFNHVARPAVQYLHDRLEKERLRLPTIGGGESL
ncbi:MAG: alpha/beta hydrolase-fold protein [Planctomycetaceae bacterium]